MAQKSNKELAAEAATLAALLGLDPPKTDELKNPQLVELVATLQKQIDDLPPLPADHKRPSVEEFVAKGYQAEDYERQMLSWEVGLRRALLPAKPPEPPSTAANTEQPTPPAPAAPAPSAPPSPPVDGNVTRSAGGASPRRPLDAPAPRAPAAAPRRLVDGAVDGTLGGPPKAAPSGPVLRYPYTVAEGKVVNTNRGPIGSYSPVSAADFDGGAAELEALVKAGTVVRSK